MKRTIHWFSTTYVLFFWVSVHSFDQNNITLIFTKLVITDRVFISYLVVISVVNNLNVHFILAFLIHSYKYKLTHPISFTQNFFFKTNKHCNTIIHYYQKYLCISLLSLFFLILIIVIVNL